MGPYIKVLMDEVFGQSNFQNEDRLVLLQPRCIDSRKRLLPKAFDQILYYVKNKAANTYAYTTLTGAARQAGYAALSELRSQAR